MNTANPPSTEPTRIPHAISLWAPFVLATALTLVADKFGWRLTGWFWVLSALGLLSLAFGIRVIWRTRGRLWAVALVVASLVIGQLWFIEIAAMVLFWSSNGFAP